MATLTFQHSSFADGLVTIEFDVNDANWRVSRIRCINNSAYPAVARVTLNGTEVFKATAAANTTTSWNTTGVQLGWDAVDGGIVMGGYEMGVQWPGQV